jgi:hypothetical protein
MQNKSHVHFTGNCNALSPCKSNTLLFVSVYFLSVLHLQYELISLTSEYLEEISRKELYRIHV